MSQSMLRNDAKTRSVKQAFTYLTRFTPSGTAQHLNVTPWSNTLFGDQVGNVAAMYQQFRCLGITIRIFPIFDVSTDVSHNTVCVIGYTPATSASAPATITEISALSDVCVQSSSCSQVQTFKLGRKTLLGMARNKWYHLDTTPDPDTCVQGQIHYMSAGSNSSSATFVWLVQSTWELCAPVSYNEYLVSSLPKPVAIDASGFTTPPTSSGSWSVKNDPDLDGKVMVWSEEDPTADISPRPSSVQPSRRSSTVVPNTGPPAKAPASSAGRK